MEKYRCIKSFDSENGTHYHYNNEIDSHEYDKLNRTEQRNFEEVDNDDESDYRPFGGMGDMLNTGLPGGLDLNPFTPF